MLIFRPISQRVLQLSYTGSMIWMGLSARGTVVWFNGPICHGMMKSWQIFPRITVLAVTCMASELNSSVFWVITLCKLVWYWRFGITYRSHIQGPVCPSSWTAWPLMMGAIGSSETWVSNQLIPRNNPEDGRIQFNRGGSLRFLCRIFCQSDWQCRFCRRAIRELEITADGLIRFLLADREFHLLQHPSS